jgi:N,N'-diacetyllegionaminate synthase
MNNKVLIIAEAGVNHNGNYDLAIQLIDEAKKAGADIVKFQTAVPELVMSKFAEKADYQKVSTGEGESQLAMAKKIHLPLDAYKSLQKYCNEVGIEFLSTPFDMVSIDVLIELNQRIFKIPSGEITNLPYLRKIGSLGTEIIISTGMANLQEIEDAIKVLIDAGTKKDQITVLHCNTEYPTPMHDVNLRAMNTIQEKLGVKVGYSDHTKGIEVPIAAVTLGATVIEKHFTLDKNMEGPDHQASLEPHELKAMVEAIRNVEIAIAGSGIKETTESERKNMVIARKSILAAKDIKKGDVFDENNLIVKRPGNGINPMRWDEILGKTAIRDFQEDELIEF